MYSVQHNNAFTALVVTSFGRYDHHQANTVQNLKMVVTCGAWEPIQLHIFMQDK